jgi:hypothetical protein
MCRLAFMERTEERRSGREVLAGMLVDLAANPTDGAAGHTIIADRRTYASTDTHLEGNSVRFCREALGRCSQGRRQACGCGVISALAEFSA